LHIWHTLELLALEEGFPTLDDIPLKKVLKDSFRAIICFSRTIYVFIPSFYYSLRGSKGVSPSSPKTLSTSLTTTKIYSILA
jgi:hypothetical protein